MTIKGCKETIFLPPHNVVFLLTHTNTVDEIQMRERNDHDVVVALQKAEPLTELALADEAALAANRTFKLVLLHMTLEHLIEIIDIKPTRGKVVCLIFLKMLACLDIND